MQGYRNRKDDSMKKRKTLPVIFALLVGLAALFTCVATTSPNTSNTSDWDENWQLFPTGMPDKAYRPNP